jgi:hypothetical protein
MAFDDPPCHDDREEEQSPSLPAQIGQFLDDKASDAEAILLACSTLPFEESGPRSRRFRCKV